MLYLRTLATLGAWLVGSFVLVIAALYLTLVAINWSDQPPSDEAARLAAVVESRPPLADEHNAYVYALGFAAPVGADPRDVGRERAAWIRRVTEDPRVRLHERDPLADAVAAAPEANRSPPPVAGTFDRVCWTQRGSDWDCLGALFGREAEIADWLASELWLLERYLELVAHDAWRELSRHEHVTPWSVIGPLVAGQRLLFVQAWSLAAADQPDAVRALLDQDARFWRLALAESDSIVGRRLVTDRVRDHFRWGAIVIKQFDDGRGGEAIPDAWREPLSREELSMLRSLASEWYGAREMIEILADGGDPYALQTAPDVRPWSERISAWMARPLVQPQDFANRYAAELGFVADTLDVPVEAYPQAVERVRAHRPATTELGLLASTYNLIGVSLISMMDGVYDNLAQHAVQVSDLEGLRRATLLASEMRAAGISDGRGAVLLAPPELHDPYTGEAFLWEGETGALLFEGLDRRATRVHRIWY
jgi:hypothetical protein